jgi:hypothetical protein
VIIIAGADPLMLWIGEDYTEAGLASVTDLCDGELLNVQTLVTLSFWLGATQLYETVTLNYGENGTAMAAFTEGMFNVWGDAGPLASPQNWVPLVNTIGDYSIHYEVADYADNVGVTTRAVIVSEAPAEGEGEPAEGEGEPAEGEGEPAEGEGEPAEGEGEPAEGEGEPAEGEGEPAEGEGEPAEGEGEPAEGEGEPAEGEGEPAEGEGEPAEGEGEPAEGEGEPAEGEGEPEPLTLKGIARILLDDFDLLDLNGDGKLSPEEVLARFPNLTARQFNMLDKGLDGFLSREELEVFLAEEDEGEGEGEDEDDRCGCCRNHGNSKVSVETVKRMLGDWLLIGLSLLILAALSRERLV